MQEKLIQGKLEFRRWNPQVPPTPTPCFLHGFAPCEKMWQEILFRGRKGVANILPSLDFIANSTPIQQLNLVLLEFMTSLKLKM